MSPIISNSKARLLRIIQDKPNLGRKAISIEYGADYRSAAINNGLGDLRKMGLVESPCKHSNYRITSRGTMVLEYIEMIENLCKVGE